MSELVFAVLTISDTCHQDATKDRSGPRLVELLRETFADARIITEILPDECDLISEKLRHLVEIGTGSILSLDSSAPVSAIITTGGTGFAPRDVTPEATKAVLDKECPQLSMAIALDSLQKTKFAVLSRGMCGIARRTLIMNFPGSEKAVVECFDVVRDILPHALQLIGDDLPLVRRTHDELQGTDTTTTAAAATPPPARHICPHKTGAGDGVDRNSPYPMISKNLALEIIFKTVQPQTQNAQLLRNFMAPVNIPPFRASIKDGYAMKSSGFSGTKRVLGTIAAGDECNTHILQEDECFKINTGAAVPLHADCVVQIEDTKLLKTKKNGDEDLVEILVEPKPDLDIRPIGCDLEKGSKLFPTVDHSTVVIRSLLASVGQSLPLRKPKIAIVSTGSELQAPEQPLQLGKIYDSNSTMLEELLNYFGFECMRKVVLSDDFATVKQTISELFQTVDFVICSGGVSMGDKDYIKPVLKDLGFEIHFGRVNIKPGKPMTFASREAKYFFGLPGNPVSAFVTFHLFALPAIRWASGWKRKKCELPVLTVSLLNETMPLDARPEYMRATITIKNGYFFAYISGNQMSSCLQSIVGADVLLHMPAYSHEEPSARVGDTLRASVLRYDFISKYD